MKRLEGKLHKGELLIFSMDYLESTELTDADLSQIFDKGCLSLSFIVGMHRFVGITKTPKQIIDKCKASDTWFNDTTWTTKQFIDFRQKLINIFRNVYCYGFEKCEAKADMWLTNFGFRIDKNMK